MADTLYCPICSSPNVIVHRIIGGTTYYKCLSCGSIFKNPIIVPERAVTESPEAG